MREFYSTYVMPCQVVGPQTQLWALERERSHSHRKKITALTAHAGPNLVPMRTDRTPDHRDTKPGLYQLSYMGQHGWGLYGY